MANIIASVYAKNLDERVKIDDLTVALSEIFSEFGEIVEIVAKKNLKAKGQAFIVFNDAESATRAIEDVNGFELFEKPMILDFAKSLSYKTVENTRGKEELDKYKQEQAKLKGISSTLTKNPPFSMNICTQVIFRLHRAKRSTKGTGSTRTATKA